MINYREPCWCLCSNGKKKLSVDPSHLCPGRRDGTPYFHQFLQLLYTVPDIAPRRDEALPHQIF